MQIRHPTLYRWSNFPAYSHISRSVYGKDSFDETPQETDESLQFDDNHFYINVESPPEADWEDFSRRRARTDGQTGEPQLRRNRKAVDRQISHSPVLFRKNANKNRAQEALPKEPSDEFIRTDDSKYERSNGLMCREQKNKGHRGAQVMLANANEPSNGFLVTHGYECQQDSPLNPTDESRNPQHSEKQEQSKVLAEVKKQSESFSMLTNLSQDDRRQEGALQLQNQARLCPELETSLL